MRKSSLTVILLAAMIVLWGCQGSQGAMGSGPVRPAAAPVKVATNMDAEGGYRLHDQDVEDLGLEIVWTQKLYVNEKLVDAYVLGDLIIMETNALHLYGVDRNTGITKWMVELPSRCDFRGCEDEDQVYVPCRNTLVAIDKRGFITWRKFLKFAPAGSPVADDMHVYLPCFDGAVRAFLKDAGYFAWQYTTNGIVEAKPAVGSKLVYAGGTDGWVYAMSTEKLDLSWKFQTYGPIRADVVFNKRRVFVSSTDGSLYNLVDMPQTTREQQLDWNRPYATGAPIEKPPYVTDAMVLVVNKNNVCHAVDRRNGTPLWILPDVDKVLTVGRLNTYLLRGGSNIVAVDNKTGVVHWMRNIRPGAFAFFLVNPMDDKIYLVKADGETQAIREQRLTTGAPAPAPAPKPATTPAPAPAPEATPAPAPAPEATPAPAPEATPAPTPAPEAAPAPAPAP